MTPRAFNYKTKGQHAAHTSFIQKTLCSLLPIGEAWAAKHVARASGRRRKAAQWRARCRARATGAGRLRRAALALGGAAAGKVRRSQARQGLLGWCCVAASCARGMQPLLALFLLCFCFLCLRQRCVTAPLTHTSTVHCPHTLLAKTKSVILFYDMK